MMNRSLAIGGVTIVIWAGAFGIAFGVVEWGDDDRSDSSSRCQEAIQYFEAVDSLIEETEVAAIRIGYANDVVEPETTESIWKDAFSQMRSACAEL